LLLGLPAAVALPLRVGWTRFHYRSSFSKAFYCRPSGIIYFYFWMMLFRVFFVVPGGELNQLRL
jgi:hypothetical protein